MVTSIASEYTSTQESLELLYHISREIASTLDLTVVLQRVLALSMRTIGAVSGSIIVVNDEGIPVESTIIYEDAILDHSTEQIRSLLEGGLAGWVVNNREPALVLNTNRDERWVKSERQSEGNEKAKSTLSVPFIARDQLVGDITLSHPVPLFFTNEHLALVQAIADQAAIAVVNARLYETSQQQALLMGALAKSASSITSTLRLEDVLNRILEQISQALNVAAVSLALLDDEKESLVFYATTANADTILGKKVTVGQGIVGWVAQHNQGIIVPDVTQDPRFYGQFDKSTGFDTRSIACGPIISEGEVIGVLQALNPLDGSFGQDALTVLSGIGSLAGTAIRHAQLFEDLQAAHKRYRDLYNSSIDAILITDMRGHIIEANNQTFDFYGFTRDQLQLKHIGDVHEIDTDEIGESLEYISPEETISYESEVVTSTELIIPIEVHVHTVQIEGVYHLQWTFRDITERKELDQLRDDLLSMIYHDLRSPLGNVLSSLDVLESIQSFDHDPTVQSLFEIAVRSTKRIERLTNSLLDINRLEAGQPVTNTTPTEVASILNASVDAILPIANNKDQEVYIRIQDDIPLADVDENMIQRVLINLLENAVKYTPPESHITVGAAKTGQELCFWVEDTGPGIPEEKRPTVFDKYTRLHGKSGPKGIGLGLAYCRLAVEGHGGRIWVDAAAQGGARFAFTLPIAEDDSDF
ncbi:MAG: GAF domain-containing protein [Anaerolineales bacterium]|nr:GAF domain-containing protein [Chloroflexota bacterium]MBL6980241.1 GAF domain-containing protein [Anaerolineales bacterium]